MAVADVLRRHAAHGTLGPGHQFVELLVAADVQRAEPIEEPVQVLDRRVAEDLLAAVLIRPGDPLREMADQPGEVLEERLFGQADSFLEPSADPLSPNP